MAALPGTRASDPCKNNSSVSLWNNPAMKAGKPGVPGWTECEA